MNISPKEITKVIKKQVSMAHVIPFAPHGIAWVEYTIDPITRLKIGTNIPIDNIILSLLFNKDYSNTVVCTSFDTNTTRVPRRLIKRSFV